MIEEIQFRINEDLIPATKVDNERVAEYKTTKNTKVENIEVYCRGTHIGDIEKNVILQPEDTLLIKTEINVMI